MNSRFISRFFAPLVGVLILCGLGAAQSALATPLFNVAVLGPGASSATPFVSQSGENPMLGITGSLTATAVVFDYLYLTGDGSISIFSVAAPEVGLGGLMMLDPANPATNNLMVGAQYSSGYMIGAGNYLTLTSYTSLVGSNSNYQSMSLTRSGNIITAQWANGANGGVSSEIFAGLSSTIEVGYALVEPAGSSNWVASFYGTTLTSTSSTTSFSGFSSTPPAVPEPDLVGVFGLGLVGLIGATVKRRCA